jgi:hypothetical protein
VYGNDEQACDEVEIPVDRIHKKRKHEDGKKHEGHHHGGKDESSEVKAQEYVGGKRKSIRQRCCKQQNAVEDYLVGKLSSLGMGM